MKEKTYYSTNITNYMLLSLKGRESVIKERPPGSVQKKIKCLAYVKQSLKGKITASCQVLSKL